MSKIIKQRTLFVRLRSALEEGIQFARGQANLRVAVVPSSPAKFTAGDVFQLRQRFNLSQREFAQALNVSTKTLQSWEQGIRHPSHAALRLLQLLHQKPELVHSVLDLTPDGTPKIDKDARRGKQLGRKVGSRNAAHNG
ncbi:MAG TPA: helix-turn-helix domain-containing protein [Nitrospiraceae bacterium]|nr:helix-turn-helix domain-containing protein [Nitrospiraceae bacterium]